MPNKVLDDETLQQTVDACRIYGDRTSAATALGIAESSLRRRRRMAAERGIMARDVPPDAPVELPTFPDDDVEADQILDMMEQRFHKRLQHQKSLRWFPIKFKSSAPIALVVIGDPHLGSNGCNIPLLRHHINLMKQTPNCYPSIVTGKQRRDF